ncbi:MAG: ABC transporter ATP-binding protein [Solirubrobacterales bacterium]
MDTLLKIEKLSAGYNNKVILEDININLSPGEFIGIIGPNGTGKSTLIKAITDLIDIKTGTIRISGIDNRKLSRRDRAKLIAVVPQEYTIDFKFTVFDIVLMGRNPHMYGRKNSEKDDFEIVKEAMVMTKTWQLKDRDYNELSGGEKQRVIIARAIAQDTKIILLDEPTSHLDIHHQLEIMELISSLKVKNIGVMAVLHDINMAARFSSRLILLNKGKVVADGTPDEVIDLKYLDRVYKMEMVVRENKVLSSKEIVPIRVIKENESFNNKVIHVISGGGRGEQIIERINSLGFKVTCGVLNQGDSDLELCHLLGIKCVEELPFSHISDIKAYENKRLINEADIILVTDVPFGTGNIKNLEMLMDIDKRIFMKKVKNQIDFTGGNAIKIIDELQKKDSFKHIESFDEFIDIICKD